MSDRIDTARLRALCEAATPGPWHAHPASVSWDGKSTPGWPPDLGCVASLDDGEYIENANATADAAFIAAARTALPALLDEVDRLRASLQLAEARSGPRWLPPRWRREADHD